MIFQTFLPLNMSHSKSHTTAHTQDQNYKMYVKSKQQQHRIVRIKIIHTVQTDVYRETSNIDLVLLAWKTEKLASITTEPDLKNM